MSIRLTGANAKQRTERSQNQRLSQRAQGETVRIAVSTHRTDAVVTNDLTQDATRGAQQACALRWKIEQFHREVKQLTGIERCNAERREFNAITLLAPFLFGFAWLLSPGKQGKPFIASSMDCLMIFCDSS